jgi:hypothetical protein
MGQLVFQQYNGFVSAAKRISTLSKDAAHFFNPYMKV